VNQKVKTVRVSARLTLEEESKLRQVYNELDGRVSLGVLLGVAAKEFLEKYSEGGGVDILRKQLRLEFDD
jgi:hypothetical protein